MQNLSICSSLTKDSYCQVMMQTGEESSAPWDIPEHTFDPDKVDLYFESKGGKIQTH